ncbi:30S ribosomal protein S9 [Candidatus Tiddalikarchaeum anstoanum]|nr:30S ribosomal protein S9 [Candidatus Tiddalikarchaeum anstoanum]
MVNKIIQTIGKRKRSIAYAKLKKGKGVIRINGINLEVYGDIISRMRIKEPVMLAGDALEPVDVSIKVEGGGFQGQAEAARLALAKAIIAYTKKDALKTKFLEYDRRLLVADKRRTEPQKPNRSAARSVEQMSKR